MVWAQNQLNSVTQDYFKNQTTDIYFTENVILYKLMGSGKMELHLISGKDTVDGGTMIREFIEYGRSNVGTYGTSSTIDTAKAAIVNNVRFPWAGYAASNTIDLDEQTQNSGSGQMVDLIYAKMQNIQKSIRDYMGAGIYVARASSGDAYGFSGLADLFDSSLAYGELTTATEASWATNLNSDSEAISYKVMQELFRDASVGQSRDAKPDLVVTTQLLKDGYTRTLQTQQRFQDSKLAEAGFQNILHDGVPIVYDDNQTAGYVDCLNTKFLKIKTHKDYNFTIPKWESDHREPDTMTANCRWRGNLVCSHRGAQSRGTNKSDPA